MPDAGFTGRDQFTYTPVGDSGNYGYCEGPDDTVIIDVIDPNPPPVAEFTANPLFGFSPLTVSFADSSSKSPTGWAWFFGDETYNETWTLMNAGFGWSARYGHSSVATPDGSIILMGGLEEGDIVKNDVWRSTDNGVMWTQINESAGWLAREDHSSVALPDGSIVLSGGRDSDDNGQNDVWRSTDNGMTWKQVNASAGWSPRYGHSSVVTPDGSIVLMGGTDGSTVQNSVWRSTDKGATWTQVNASAGWSPRTWHRSVIVPDGSIVLMGGFDGSTVQNDVWRSTDNGATWSRQTAGAEWKGRYQHSSVAMADGSIVLMGGGRNDVWRSIDNGAHWTQVTVHAEWTGRYGLSSMAMPDGSIVLTGGWDGTRKNDVWRLVPVGSSEQNPMHTYSTPGTYQVSLQAYNDWGYNSIRKTGYVTVEAGILPLPGYTNPPTDHDGDGIYEDLNANGRLDFADVVLYFNQMTWIAANEPITAFDLNGNGRIDFADIVALFNEI